MILARFLRETDTRLGRSRVSECLVLAAISLLLPAECQPGELRGSAVDAEHGQPIAVRLYLKSSDGTYYHARSAVPNGSAIPYSRERSSQSVEIHTTLSAHPFVAELPPGVYELTAVRGKDYLPATQTIEMGDDPVVVKLPLRRWIDVAARGWFSGDTHVHRTPAEMPNLLAAEDLNVAFPLTYWVTSAHTPPNRGEESVEEPPRPEPVAIDPQHMYYPVNTEYEIFTVNGARHTLGAVFVLNHKSPLTLGAPPVRPIAEEARRQGALLDLDKHSWPWSLMIVDQMKVDLFELANNHVWRTNFAFGQWTLENKPDYVDIETDAEGFTERGWIDFGFETYYTLLNCGFRMRPTGGTANGVHPVPLGFGRVYVQLSGDLDYHAWVDGLQSGRSFVTTGPMLFLTYNGLPPGSTVELPAGTATSACTVAGSAESAYPLDRIEIVVNGEVRQQLKPLNRQMPRGGYLSPIESTVELEGSSWVVARCFERRPDGRVRFAHGSPVHFDVPEQRLRPRKAEVHFLVSRMEQELARNAGVLTPVELDEYRAALAKYRELGEDAR